MLGSNVFPTADTVTPAPTFTFRFVVALPVSLPANTLLPGSAAVPRSKAAAAVPPSVTPEFPSLLVLPSTVVLRLSATVTPRSFTL